MSAADYGKNRDALIAKNRRDREAASEKRYEYLSDERLDLIAEQARNAGHFGGGETTLLLIAEVKELRSENEALRAGSSQEADQ